MREAEVAALSVTWLALPLAAWTPDSRLHNYGSRNTSTKGFTNLAQQDVELSGFPAQWAAPMHCIYITCMCTRN